MHSLCSYFVRFQDLPSSAWSHPQALVRFQCVFRNTILGTLPAFIAQHLYPNYHLHQYQNSSSTLYKKVFMCYHSQIPGFIFNFVCYYSLSDMVTLVFKFMILMDNVITSSLPPPQCPEALQHCLYVTSKPTLHFPSSHPHYLVI